jgi:hypothetical protein
MLVRSDFMAFEDSSSKHPTPYLEVVIPEANMSVSPPCCSDR